MDPPTPHADVDMLPDDIQPTSAAADSAMEDVTEPTAAAAEEDSQMNVSDDEGAADELAMQEEDLAGVVPPATEDDRGVILDETLEELPTVEAVDVSIELAVPAGETDATPEVEVTSPSSPPPAEVLPPPPAPLSEAEVTEPVVEELEGDVAFDTQPAEGLLEVGSSAAPAPPETESFILVDVSSDAEANGHLGAVEEHNDVKDHLVEEAAESADAAGETLDELEEHVSEHGEGVDEHIEPEEFEHEDRFEDSESISSSQADPNGETALFSITERSFQMPVTISYQHIVAEEDADSLQTVTFALFQPSDLPSSSTAPPLKVLLESQHNLYDATLSELFDALREEAAFASGNVLNIEDEDGTREWVLEHMNDAVCLTIGEDNASAHDFTLGDIAQIHQLCDLPEPLQLWLKPGPVRFAQRIQLIKSMRDVMDGEESGADAEQPHEEDGEELDGDHARAVLDGGYVNSDDDVDDVPPPAYDFAGAGVDELGEGSDDEVQEIAPPTVKPSVAVDEPQSAEFDLEEDVPLDEGLGHGRAAHGEHVAVVDGEPQDYPNGPDDPDVPFDQVNDAPGFGVEAEADHGRGDFAEDETDFAIAQTADDTGISTDSKIVVTANGDLEVPVAAHHVETDLGSFNEEEAVRQVGDEAGAEASEPASGVEDLTEDAQELLREVEEEAAAETTAGGDVEQVPVPEPFAHEHEHDEGDEDLLVIENNGDAQVLTGLDAPAQPTKRKRTPPAPNTEAPQDVGDDAEDHDSDHTLAESDLIIVGEEDQLDEAAGADEAGDGDDRDAKRHRADVD